MWNGNALPTTFIDSDHLQTPITQQTFASFGGSTGSTVQISVSSPASVAVVGCPNGGNSATLALLINSSLLALARKPRNAVYWQPENASVAALTLVPAVTVRFVLVEVELVSRSDG